MYLQPYSSPGNRTSVKSHVVDPAADFVDVPANDDRVWVILYNPGTKALGVCLGCENFASIIIPAKESFVVPAPVYLGPIRSFGPIVVTEMLKYA